MRFINRYCRSKIVVGLVVLLALDGGWTSRTYPMQVVSEKVLETAVVRSTGMIVSVIVYCQEQIRSTLMPKIENFFKKAEVVVSPETIKKVVASNSTIKASPYTQQTVTADTIKNQPLVRSQELSKANAQTVVSPTIARKVVLTQVNQAVYESLLKTEKDATQKIINHISVDRNIDWHKQTAQDSSKVHARYVDEIVMKAKSEQSAHIRKIAKPAGIRVEADIGKGMAYGEMNVKPRERTFDEMNARYEARRANDSLNDILHDLNFQKYQDMHSVELKQVVNILAYGKMIIEGDTLDRITALLSILEMEAPQKELPALFDLQQSLYTTYFHSDQTLCAQALVHGCNAQEFFTHYQNRVNDQFERAFDSFEAKKYTKQHVDCIALSDKPFSFAQTVHNNEINKAVLKMTKALLSGDIAMAKQINEQLKDNNVGRIFNAGYKDWQARVEKQKQRIEAARKDSFGIYHFDLPDGQRDPVFTALSDKEKVALQKNTKDLKEFNDYLSVRQFLKQQLHEAWDIPHTAPDEVHQALYALFDNNAFVQIATVIDCIHEISTNPAFPPQKQQNIVNALFHPNGIIKELASDNRNQSFKASPAIISIEHANTRRILNRLLLLETDHPIKHVRGYATRGIDYLQAAFTVSDKDLAKPYLSLANEIYMSIVNNKESTAGLVVDLSCYYSNVNQQTLQKDLVNVLAAYIAVEQYETSIKNASGGRKLSSMFMDFHRILEQVHSLNQKGEIVRAREKLVQNLAAIQKGTQELPVPDLAKVVGDIITRYELDVKREKERKQCGAAQAQKDTPLLGSECSPTYNVGDGAIKSSCPPELDKHKDERIWGAPAKNNEGDPEKARQCGYTGQTIPDMAGATISVGAAEEKGKEREKAEEVTDPDVIKEEPNSTSDGAAKTGEPDGVLDVVMDSDIVGSVEGANDNQNYCEKVDVAISNLEFIKQAEELLKNETLTIAQKALLNEVIKAYKSQQATSLDSIAILKDGYYEVNGFKFTKFYYEKLWAEGRKAPTLIVKDILENCTEITRDTKLSGFFRYECDGWELIYNPVTCEIWHLSPIKKLKPIGKQ